MDFKEIILKRRSVRKFSQEKVSKEKLQAVLTAGLLAPSSRNRKPCEFFVIEDSTLLKKLSLAKAAGSSFLADAPSAIAVCADSEKADTWVEDSSIALTHMHLAAVEEALSSCWIQIHLRSAKDGSDSEKIVRELLGLSENWRIVGLLALGNSSETPCPHTQNDADFTKVYWL